MVIKESVKTDQTKELMFFSEESILQSNEFDMVPVVENARLGTSIIKLEDILSLSESYNISDLGVILTKICEANELNPSDVSFSIQDYKLLESDEIAGLVNGLINEGVKVFAVPMSSTNPIKMVGDAILETAIETGDWDLFDTFINEDVEILLEKVSDKKLADQLNQHFTNQGGQQIPIDPNVVKQAKAGGTPNQSGQKPQQQTQVTAKPAASQPSNGGQNIQSTVQNMVKKSAKAPREYVANALKWVHDKINDINAKLSKDGQNAPIWKKVLAYLSNAAKILAKKLHNFVAKDDKAIK